MSHAQYADKRSMLHVIYPKLEAEKETLTPLWQASYPLTSNSGPSYCRLPIQCPAPLKLPLVPHGAQ